jgi:hypothetical protein
MHIQPVRPQILVEEIEEIKEVPLSETSTTATVKIMFLPPYFTLGITVLPYLRTGNT